MKTLTQYINEVENDNEYLGYSFDEMVQDYKALAGMSSLKDRKVLGQKYGIDSGKTKDVENAILSQMREERKTRKDYTKDDINYYYRIDTPDKKKIGLESTDFILFMKDVFYADLEKKNLIKKIALAKSRDWNYYMTGADKYAIARYLDVVAWLDAHDTNKIAAKEEQENIINAIKVKLFEQTQEFHDEYIRQAKAWAAKNYDYQERQEEKYLPLVEKCKEQLNEIGTYSWGDIETRNKVASIKKELDGYRSILNKARAVTLWHKEEYISKCEKDAEDAFNHNIGVLATKVNDKGIDVSKMTVERIDDDPKFFEMFITDGTTNLYARSIWAAEYSEKVTAHFRFIVTDTKRK